MKYKQFIKKSLLNNDLKSLKKYDILTRRLTNNKKLDHKYLLSNNRYILNQMKGGSGLKSGQHRSTYTLPNNSQRSEAREQQARRQARQARKQARQARQARKQAREQARANEQAKRQARAEQAEQAEQARKQPARKQPTRLTENKSWITQRRPKIKKLAVKLRPVSNENRLKQVRAAETGNSEHGAHLHSSYTLTTGKKV
jgi:hypothetical protein